MTEDIEVASILVDPGIYELQSVQSSSRYFVSTTLGESPRYVRLAGDDSRSLRLDTAWHALIALISHPVEWAEGEMLPRSMRDAAATKAWTLRLGSSHTYLTPDRTPGRGPVYWVQSSACRRLIRHDTMPDFLAEIPLDDVLLEQASAP
ncbi:hypothetical protein [Demequina sp. NBRC 110055]|uniref:hypothetical protein n=1 Tax=Demequina sp. NBRC 110055 TaxID=1570344 RepID=UPI0009FF5E1F|nr:hypothetical protein [Demequina sp. NBRC 110055]